MKNVHIIFTFGYLYWYYSHIPILLISDVNVQYLCYENIVIFLKTKMGIELLLLFFGLLWFHHIITKRALPPGPFSLPIIGTLDIFQKGKSLIEILFCEKYHSYQPFCTFFLGPSFMRSFILINDFALAKELFMKEEFSARPTSYRNSYILGHEGQKFGIINSDGPVWSEQRRFALKQLKDLG